MLIAREAHNVNHDGAAGTLLRMRKKAWVIQGRRLAKMVIDSCVICKKIKAKHCQQVMSGLLSERVSPSNPDEFTFVVLFGSYKVKEEVKIRTRTIKGVLLHGFTAGLPKVYIPQREPEEIMVDAGTNFVGSKRAPTL